MPAAGTVPAQITGVTDATDVAAGDSNGYFLRSNGTVWAWGINDEGELGNGQCTCFPNVKAILTPTQVIGLPFINALGSGTGNAYALPG